MCFAADSAQTGAMRTVPTVDQSIRVETDLPSGDDDRVAGFGVIGLPFLSGHYLALRCFSASSFGPPYKSLWHRDPAGAWSVYTTVDASYSCPRYIGPALARPAIVAPIDVRLVDESSVRVYIDDVVDWTFTIAPTRATSLMSAMGDRMSERAWANRWVLGVLGRMAGPMLSAGRLRLTGAMPSGHVFKAAPRRVWSIQSAVATVEGVELGPIGPLATQAKLGDFWLPQRGIFFANGVGRFESPGS
jgi:hypothetical protein